KQTMLRALADVPPSSFTKPDMSRFGGCTGGCPKKKPKDRDGADGEDGDEGDDGDGDDADAGDDFFTTRGGNPFGRGGGERFARSRRRAGRTPAPGPPPTGPPTRRPLGRRGPVPSALQTRAYGRGDPGALGAPGHLRGEDLHHLTHGARPLG